MSAQREKASAPPALVVAGPTASGKSALALALAESFAGTVINADAMQVYAELEVLTARPDATALAAAPHRLYGVVPARERCSAGRWREMALVEMEAATAAGRLPVLAGGTGLYLKALEEGLAEVPPVPPAVREAARGRLEEIGAAALRAEVAVADPQGAARLHPNDRQRLLRAWEVLRATGRPLSQWQREGGGAPCRHRLLWLVLLPPREGLYAACDARLEAMVADGALDEVRRLLAPAPAPDLPAMKALGVRELAAHLRGETSLPAALAAAQTLTRRYAKRQLTWLRTEVMGHKSDIMVIESQFSENLLPEIFAKVRRFLLTPPD